APDPASRLTPEPTPRSVPEPAPEPSPARDGAAGPDDWMATDHLVGGTPLLPGVAVFELALRAAGRTAPARIRQVRWLRAFELTGSRTPRLVVDGERFTLSDGPDGVVHASGTLAAAAPEIPERIDPTAIGARCPGRRSGPDLYAAFAGAGIEYGPSFRALDEVRHGADEALGVLNLPPARAAEVPGRPLHPVALDAALQAVAALSAETGSQVPFALRELEIHGPVPSTGYAHVVRDEDGFTVRLAHRDGRVAVRFTGLALRPSRPAAAPVPDGAGALVHLPEWHEAGPVE
ncbi:polyketide synthase dehydratase domain-containing protein, partial [Streptomyces parvus]